MPGAAEGLDVDRQIFVQLVIQLLNRKPTDPVPFVYSYLKQLGDGVAEPVMPTNLDVAEIKNLRKKYEYLKSQVMDDDEHTPSEDGSDDEMSEEEEKTAPVKQAGKKQRAGVSAEVFGEWNKKEDFTPPSHPKSDTTKDRLRTRLLQAFMFNALDEKELAIVIDAIQEVQCKVGDVVIKEGDAGDCMYVLEEGALNCTKVFKGNTEPTQLKVYQPGEGFGELALLYNAPRAATITATAESTVWRLDRDTFTHIVKDSAQ